MSELLKQKGGFHIPYALKYLWPCENQRNS